MIGYVRQLQICESIRNALKHQLTTSFDWKTQMRADIPSTDTILRALSISLKAETEEQVKLFVTEYILNRLQLTETQREQLQVSRNRL